MALMKLVATIFAATLLFTGPASAAGVKLYVGNLPFAISDEDLRTQFSQYGSVYDVLVVTDKGTGKPVGTAFVSMSSLQEAQAAIAGLNGKELNGRKWSVALARPVAERGTEHGTRSNPSPRLRNGGSYN